MARGSRVAVQRTHAAAVSPVEVPPGLLLLLLLLLSRVLLQDSPDPRRRRGVRSRVASNPSSADSSCSERVPVPGFAFSSGCRVVHRCQLYCRTSPPQHQRVQRI